MKPSTYRSAAEKILKQWYDPTRFKRADRLLAVATKKARKQ